MLALLLSASWDRSPLTCVKLAMTLSMTSLRVARSEATEERWSITWAKSPSRASKAVNVEVRLSTIRPMLASSPARFCETVAVLSSSWLTWA